MLWTSSKYAGQRISNVPYGNRECTETCVCHPDVDAGFQKEENNEKRLPRHCELYLVHYSLYYRSRYRIYRFFSHMTEILVTNDSTSHFIVTIYHYLTFLQK